MKDQKSLSDLRKEENALREEISKLRFDLSLGKLKDTNAVKKKRRDLARVLTRTGQLEMIEEQDA